MVDVDDRTVVGSRKKARKQSDEATARAIDRDDFAGYQTAIIHDWLRTITTLAFTLVPFFFVLDIFMMPSQLLPRFAIYRLASTLLALAQHIVVRRTKPSRWSYVHGYLISVQVGAMIALMTVNLGGFDSTYYAGLNLVMIGVNLLMPWQAAHTAINTAVIVLMYVGFNLIAGHPFDVSNLVNNLYFLLATAIIAVSINHVRYRLIEKEFTLLVELKSTRDALWSEMELAKRIQTALLPVKRSMRGYEIAAVLEPAAEVGGDYYDFIETDAGDRWLAIGDVSGHGVDSGLIMMMTQTSILTVIKSGEQSDPIKILSATNTVIRENISRLGSNHYMTLMLINLEDDGMRITGHHQDVLVYRAGENKVVAISSNGTWLGITDQIDSFLETSWIDLVPGDLVMLFTDGITEAMNSSGELYGQERLTEALQRNSTLPLDQAVRKIVDEVNEYQVNQSDDMTLILLKKIRS